MSLKDSLRVLVVDDMAASRGILVNALENFGIRNVFSENKGEDALSFLLKHPVHLVVSDYNMPGMNGLGLLKAMPYSRPLQPRLFDLTQASSHKT